MMRRIVLVCILAAAMAAPVSADTVNVAGLRKRVERPAAWICAMVKARVAQYSNRTEALRAARAEGWTAAQIQAGRLCL